MEKDSGTHVELGDDAKYAVKGEGTILFQLESGGSFEAQDVLYVPELKKNFLSVSVLEDKGFVVMFKKGKVLIRPEGASPDTTVSIGVREGKLYRLQGKPVCRSKGILDLIHSYVNGPMSVAEDEEKKALKGDQSSETSSSGSQPSGGEEELAPSSSVKKTQLV
jgi:hypothetical protein